MSATERLYILIEIGFKNPDTEHIMNIIKHLSDS